MDMSDIAERLESRFGLGSRPELRQRLYRDLESRVYEGEQGERVFEVIASVAADAVGKRDPGRYFAYVVQRRLAERGMIPAKEVSF